MIQGENMSKYWYVLVIMVLMMLLLMVFLIFPKHGFFPKSEEFVVINYYFANDFKGCAIYNVSNSSPLEVKHETINYYFDEDGILLTSSPQVFG